ncbi:MAG: nucleotide exchange factor GrpE [Bacillota bacterium]|jgi:molecular chaperone GrpE|nr:nucleotide exchange factor GrpE [Bacillota bacterium]
MSPDTQDMRLGNIQSSDSSEVTGAEANGEHTPEDLPSNADMVNEGDELRLKLAEAEAKAEENWNMYLRALADLENYQRRTARDLEFTIRSGKKEMFLKLLAIVDDMERALAADADYESLHQGVEMIRRKLLDALASEGVKPIDALNEPFDPRLHEAVAACDGEDVETETVVEEFRRGYTYCNECLRPTMARVAVPKSD